jgi:hypothetical protein
MYRNKNANAVNSILGIETKVIKGTGIHSCVPGAYDSLSSVHYAC